MQVSDRGPWLAGVDGCAAGWLVAFVRARDEQARVGIFRGFVEIVAAPEAPAIIAVDIPIGLPARASRGGRAAENAVRPLLGGRQSSVFSVPSRAAVYANDYGAACRVARATSDPSRAVSKQLYMIAAKIREVDSALRSDLTLARRVFEVHPEVSFWQLNGQRSLDQPKRVKGRPYAPGLELRRRLLVADGLSTASVYTAPPDGAAADDVVDALACAAIARRIFLRTARPFPDPPPVDEFGLPMAIWT